MNKSEYLNKRLLLSLDDDIDEGDGEELDDDWEDLVEDDDGYPQIPFDDNDY